jgi:hypothetical protein
MKNMKTQTESKHIPTLKMDYSLVIERTTGGEFDFLNGFHGTVGRVKKEYASIIVRAVNSHEALLEAAKEIIFEINEIDTSKPSRGAYAKLKEAIAQAEAK